MRFVLRQLFGLQKCLTCTKGVKRFKNDARRHGYRRYSKLVFREKHHEDQHRRGRQYLRQRRRYPYPKKTLANALFRVLLQVRVVGLIDFCRSIPRPIRLCWRLFLRLRLLDGV